MSMTLRAMRLLPLLFATLVPTALAQTAAKPDGVWRGALGAGATASHGNSNSLTATFNGDAVRQTQIDKLSGFAQVVYGRRSNNGIVERTSELYRAGGLYTRDLSPLVTNTFGFGALEFERNPLADLDLRSVVAAGIGAHIISRPGFTFDVSTGPAYKHERRSAGRQHALEWLFAEESTHVLNANVSFRQRLAIFPNLSESGRFRAVFDAGLVVKIAGNWAATISLNERYQSDPPPGVKNNDLLLITGVQYTFNP